MPFRTALSGLNAASAELRVIGQNVANASTTGFKKSRAEFADIFATSSLGTTSNAIGAGVRVSSVSQQFTQGNIGFTDNNLDLAISGQGFFRLNDNGVTVFSRAGQFSVDRDGYVVNGQAQRLTAFGADTSGNINGAMNDLRLDTSDIAPSATTSIDMGLNLDAADAVPAAPNPTSAISLGGTDIDSLGIPGTSVDSPVFTIYDRYGTAIPNSTVRFTYQGGAGSNEWTAELRPGGNPASPASISSNIIMDASSPNVASLTWDPDGAGGPQTSVTVGVNVGGINTNNGSGSNLAFTSQDGAVQGAFSATDSTSYNSSTSLTVYDSLGAPHLATMYFRKSGTPNQWEMFTSVDGSQVSSGPGPGTSDQLTFTPGGVLSAINGTSVPPTSMTTPLFTPTGGAASQTLSLNLANLNQYGSEFAVNQLSQDGFATGRLNGVDISDTGIITARFTNGQSRTLGQVALANFQNAQGLRQLGDTSWAETFESGAPLVGSPSSGSLGLIESGALEGSNVDLTEQLVGMITAQRNFQANAQVITTADTVTQTIINIR